VTKNTALHLACKTRDLKMIRQLVNEFEADISIENSKGETPTSILESIQSEGEREQALAILNKESTDLKFDPVKGFTESVKREN